MSEIRLALKLAEHCPECGALWIESAGLRLCPHCGVEEQVEAVEEAAGDDPDWPSWAELDARRAA